MVHKGPHDGFLPTRFELERAAVDQHASLCDGLLCAVARLEDDEGVRRASPHLVLLQVDVSHPAERLRKHLAKPDPAQNAAIRDHVAAVGRRGTGVQTHAVVSQLMLLT